MTESFVAALERRGDASEGLLRPQRDKLWLRLSGGKYWLDALEGGKKSSWMFDEEGIIRLAQFLGIGSGLWQTLRELKPGSAVPAGRAAQTEECRLANKLLWHKGEGDGEISLVRMGNTIVDVRAPSKSGLQPRAIAARFGRMIETGSIEVLRWDVGDDGYWCLGRYPSRKDGFTREGASKPDAWGIGFIFANMERKNRSAVVVPGLIRTWGGVFLPLAKATWRIRGHGRTSSAALLDALMADVASLEAIDVSSSTASLGMATKRRWSAKGIRRDLGPEWRDRALTEILDKTGESNYAYTFITTALAVAAKQEDVFKRLERAVDVADFAARLGDGRLTGNSGQ